MSASSFPLTGDTHSSMIRILYFEGKAAASWVSARNGKGKKASFEVMPPDVRGNISRALIFPFLILDRLMGISIQNYRDIRFLLKNKEFITSHYHGSIHIPSRWNSRFTLPYDCDSIGA
jgi:hypothetical protein